MQDDVKSVKALPGFKLQIELSDGRAGIFDMRAHLDHPGLTALTNPTYFAQVHVLLGAPTWPNGEDVAPSTIAAELQATLPA